MIWWYHERFTFVEHSIRRYTPQTPEYDIPYLGAEEVIEEVITLLAHLENDRRDTKDLLREESKRVILLQERIDMMCHKRLLELPDAVQRGTVIECIITPLTFRIFWKKNLVSYCNTLK